MANANTEYTLLKIVFPRYEGRKADSTKVVVDSFPLFRFFVERIWRRNCRFDSFQLQMKYMAASVKHASCFWHFFPKFEHRNRFFSLFFFFDESLDIVFSWSSEFIHRSLIERSAIDTNLYYLKKFLRGNDLERVSRFENQLPPRRFPTEPVKFSSKTRSH